MPRLSLLLALLMIASSGLASSSLGGAAPAPSASGHARSHGPPAAGEPAFDTSGPWSRVLEPGAYAIGEPEVLTLRSHVDNATIAIGIVRPIVPEGVRVPVLVRASPYMLAMTPDGIRRDYEYGMRVENFVPHGYAVAFVPVRGTSSNGGCMEMGSFREQADLDQALDALAAQPWSSGHLAAIGLSYDAYLAAFAAGMNEHVKTVILMGAAVDPWELISGNGTMPRQAAPAQSAVMWGFGFAYEGPTYPIPSTEMTLERRVNGVACTTMVDAVAGSDATLPPEGRTPYWAERDARPGILERYHGSTLIVQGLRDANVIPSMPARLGWALEERGLEVSWILGQWGHMFPDVDPATNASHEHARWDWAQRELEWFDAHLKHLPATARARVEVEDTSGAWRADDAFPSSHAATRTISLRLTGVPSIGGHIGPRIVTEAASPNGNYGTYSPNLDHCLGCASFDVERFTEDTIVTGAPRVHLNVTALSPDANVGAWLVAVHPDGSSMLLSAGGIALRNPSEETAPRDLRPGMTVDARIQLEPLDAFVHAGDKLRLILDNGHWYNPTRGQPYALGLSAPVGWMDYEAFPAAGRATFDPLART